MISRADIRALRTPLIALGVSLLVVCGLIYTSSALLKSARAGLAQRQTELRDARMRIQNADLEKDMIGRYLAEYQRLAQTGLVGEEQRINWLDALRVASVEANMSGVEYEIGAQRPYAYAAEFNAGQLLLQQSVMRLRFKLLHEGDLPRFFTALQRQGGGFFTLDQCTMKRAKAIDAAATITTEPNVTAECEVSWVTAKPRTEPEKKR